MVINIDSSEQSRAKIQLQPTLGARAPPRPTSRSGDPPHPTSRSGAPPHPASGSGAPSRPTPHAWLLMEARTAANHYGPESINQGQTSGIV